MLTYSSPRLIAVSHVLRRQSVPWHPPDALICLILVLYYFLTRLPMTLLRDHRSLLASSFPCAVFKVLLSSLFRSLKTIQNLLRRVSISLPGLNTWQCSALSRSCDALSHRLLSFSISADRPWVWSRYHLDQFSLERR